MRRFTVLCLLTWMACATDTEEVAPADSSPAEERASLSPSSSDAEIMEHLYRAELEQKTTDALTSHFPEMTRDRAYAIQKLRLAHREQSSRRVGWKIGWSRLANPDDELDPVVGHVMEDRLFPEGEPLSTRYFVEGTTGAEAEVVFYLNKDLPGPEVSAEQVADAVEAVGVAMEFVSGRLTQPHEREHAVADNVYGAGVVLGAQRFELDDGISAVRSAKSKSTAPSTKKDLRPASWARIPSKLSSGSRTSSRSRGCTCTRATSWSRAPFAFLRRSKPVIALA